jgi:ABC-type lipoprotein release transport system permease subunit
MMLWTIAWRNLWRHRGRTLIMASAVALAYGLLLLGMGVNDYMHQRMLNEAARAAGGDVLVHADGYWDTRATDRVIPDGARTTATIAAVPGVGAAIPRVLTTGLVSTAVDSRPVLLQGVHPERERHLQDPARHLYDGSFLDDGRRDGIVLGRRLADRLEVDLGDRVVLTATGPDGEMTRALFHLAGVIQTGTRDLDEVLGFTTIEAAQRALGMDGAITQIGIVLADGATADSVAARVAAAVGAAGSGLEVFTWVEAVPEMIGMLEMDAAMDAIYMAIIFLVVLFSIANTFLMAVMERVREFGLLNALGLDHRRIGQLLLNETALLTAVAMAAGLFLALVGHTAVNHWGIPIAAYGVDEFEMGGIDASDMVIYSMIVPKKWVLGSLFIAGATVASALYPAWRATRLAPAEAMRFYE